MCYNSPTILAEIERLSKDIGLAIGKELSDLDAEGKRYLFAGVTVGDEPSLDDYSAFANAPSALADFIKNDGTALEMLGFCALSNRGFSLSNPPADLRLELAKINQEFIAFWAKTLNEAGIPRSSMYTHIPAGADEVG